MPAAPLAPGQEIELAIERLAATGEGVGRHEGFVVFVPLTAPGDRVRARVTRTERRHARAEVVALLAPGPHRTVPPCPVVEACGGCAWQQVDYATQLAWKRQVVVDALERVGRLRGVPVAPCLGMEDPWHYRNKAAVPFARAPDGQLAVGFYRRGTHRVVDLPGGCALQHPLVNRLVAAVREEAAARGLPPYEEETGAGLLRHLVVRVGVRTREALAVLVVNGRALPGEQDLAVALMRRVPELVGVVVNANTARTNVILGPTSRVVAGRDHVFEELGGLRFKVSARSFFQVNPVQAERLYSLALEAAGLGPADLVVDAYSGTGTLTLLAARRCRLAVGIEEVEDAVADARENARLNGIANVRFLAGRVEERLEGIRDGGRAPDVVLLDPPRKGCAEAVLRACLALRPRLVYVSCNPVTLARDLARLSRGYRVGGVWLVDLFPHTAHVECVAHLLPLA